MRTFATAACVPALGVPVSPRSTEAQVQVGPTLACHDDFDVGIGGTLSVPMPALGDRIGFMAVGPHGTSRPLQRKRTESVAPPKAPASGIPIQPPW